MSAAALRPPPQRPRPKPAPRVPAKAPAASGFVAAFDPKELQSFDTPMGTDFFDTLGRIAAHGVPREPAPSRSPAEQRGYSPESLRVVAGMATHYLYSGGYRLAEVLFEGLTSVAPDEPYHWLALGLTYDRQSRLQEAERAYEAAAARAPNDARAFINLAELRAEAGDLDAARTLLAKAAKLAERSADLALRRKAETMAARFGVVRSPVRRPR